MGKTSKIYTQYYVDAPESMVKRLGHFRTNYAQKVLKIHKWEWHYYTAGNPDLPPLLLLHGGGGDAETMFMYIERMSRDFYVLAPNIPPKIHKLDDVIAGLHALLNHEQIDQVQVVGLSFGAMLAQLYIRRFMTQVSQLVITHTVIPSDHIGERVSAQLDLMRLYPAPLLKWFSRRAYNNGIENSTTPASAAECAFWQAYFQESYSTRITKRHLISRARLTLEYHLSQKFQSKDLRDWSGDMLLIESGNDDVISEGDRGAIKGMYPRAFVQTLDGYDHLAPILAADELTQSMTRFLRKEELNLI